ncbi:MAG: HEAT repeat domain-containing protein [Desulfosalsimonadaceae bacterium]
MQKFLIIVKFATIDHFCQFHRQLSSGSVFLPSARPLPENSRTLLHLRIPEVKPSFLFPGKIIPTRGNVEEITGMTVDVSLSLPHLLPGLNRALAATDTYRNRLSLPSTETAEADLDLSEFSELMAEPEFQEHESGPIEIMDEPGPPSPPPDEFTPETSLDDALMDLEMEDSTEYLSKKRDPEIRPEVQPEVPLKDDVLEFRLQTDDEEIQLHQSEGRTPASPVLSAVRSDDLSGILFDDVKHMVDQVEFEREIVRPLDFSSKKILEKKDLTPEERALAEPVGKFFMNLTKAMLRSGYYDPGHPSSNSAKKGLYDEFITVSGECREIMITHQTTREGTDMMLTGILDEPVSIRQLVGPGVAELFVPKLSAYCEKKKLLSFAVKQDIVPDHFYDFIDIMSDPQVDNQGEGKAGHYLTGILVSRGITEISTIFAGDMVELETNLPWRVEMAIHRLAKDLKVLPMFKGVSSDSVKNMKLQAVKDIIRPLKHPQYLNDFLVNSYMIARYVETMPPEDIEEMIVAAFSIDLLLPTTQFTFKELDSLNQLKFEQPDNEQIPRRLAGIRRILKLIARRVVVEKVPGARHFLHLLHGNNILGFDELPADVQYFINSEKMADDVHHNFSKYEDALDHLKDPDEALVYLQCFRRVVPVLAESDRWDSVSRIAVALKKACSRQPMSSDKVYSGLKVKRKEGIEDFSASPFFQSLKPADRPIAFVFNDIADHIFQVYGADDKNQRRILDHIIDDLGSFGVNILSRMLTDSPDREVRKQSFESLITKGVQAQNWAVAVLDDPKHPWFVHRNAMMILAKVSHEAAGFDCVRKFLDHSNPKIREEILNVIASLHPDDAEALVVGAFDDEAPKVRWLASKTLTRFVPVSESAMNRLMMVIARPMPREKDPADLQVSKIVGILSAINAMQLVPSRTIVESQILETLKSIIGEKKSLWKKVKSVVATDHEETILKAAAPLLGKIGGDASRAFLKQAAKSHPDLSEIIKKAMMQIKS